jgi:uncharacterized protein YjbI with pentapeptide repeats
LAGADLSGADLGGADFSNTDFTLIGHDRMGPHTDPAVFNGANLEGTNFENAYLFYVDFSGTDLDELAIFDGAAFCQATMPDGSLNNRGCPSQ